MNRKRIEKKVKKMKKPLLIAAIGTGVVTVVTSVAVGMGKSIKKMKESAKAQHEVDKAEFAAAKAESKAQWEEAKAQGSPAHHEAAMQTLRDRRVQLANQRKAEAEARIAATKDQ